MMEIMYNSLREYDKIVELNSCLKNELKYNYWPLYLFKNHEFNRGSSHREYNVDDLVRLHKYMWICVYHKRFKEISNVSKLIDLIETKFNLKYNISSPEYFVVNHVLYNMIHEREKIESVFVDITMALEHFKNLKYKLFDHLDMYYLQNIHRIINLDTWNNYLDKLSRHPVEVHKSMIYKHYIDTDKILKEEFLFFSEMVDLITRDRISFTVFLTRKLNTDIVQKIFEYV